MKDFNDFVKIVDEDKIRSIVALSWGLREDIKTLQDAADYAIAHSNCMLMQYHEWLGKE